jgi:hypothetical protein
LHDAVTAERLGVPAIGVMTERFVSAAELMARVLGMPGYPFVVIPHPVSSASDDDLREMAIIAAEGVRRLLFFPKSAE